jgi:hypothetical protein
MMRTKTVLHRPFERVGVGTHDRIENGQRFERLPRLAR